MPRLSAVNPFRDKTAEAYSRDVFYSPIIRYCSDLSDDASRSLSASTRAQIARYSFDGKFLMYQIDQYETPRIFVPLDVDLCACILHEHHDSATSGHLVARRRISRYLGTSIGPTCISGSASGFGPVRCASAYVTGPALSSSDRNGSL